MSAAPTCARQGVLQGQVESGSIVLAANVGPSSGNGQKLSTLSDVLERVGELSLRETVCVFTRNGTCTLGVEGVASDRLPHSMCLKMKPLYSASSSKSSGR